MAEEFEMSHLMNLRVTIERSEWRMGAQLGFRVPGSRKETRDYCPSV